MFYCLQVVPLGYPYPVSTALLPADVFIAAATVPSHTKKTIAAALYRLTRKLAVPMLRHLPNCTTRYLLLVSKSAVLPIFIGPAVPITINHLSHHWSTCLQHLWHQQLLHTLRLARSSLRRVYVHLDLFALCVCYVCLTLSGGRVTKEITCVSCVID